ncbi:MAG TPA: enoyl-CoA hydratase-related protein [Polyangiaceae bacterium]|nr:enoyl-CoA hydratase-related protein [Polyangiaceae bacterium]
MVNPVTVTRHENIAVITLNNPPVNALSHAVRVPLLATLKELFATPEVEALVIACDGRTFIAGADIREFGKPPLDPDLPELIEFLDTAPQLTIAAIHGTALGGGLELALACDFRIATQSAKVGLPEVTLGILPGAGGTQRLPRLIGVGPALDLILSGTPISAAQAQRLGVLDELTADGLPEFALAFARRALLERRAHRRASALSATLDAPGLFAAYETRTAQRWRGFLAPFRCIAAVRAALELPFGEGLLRERELFRELMASPESKAQRHVFFGEREVAKVPGLADDTEARPIKSVAVLGDSPKASGIARCFADAGITVTLLANDPSVWPEGAKSADLLLEAVADEPDAKRTALAQLDAIAKPSAILASTSELLDLAQLAASTSRPADVVGLHFAAPIEEAKLIENVRSAHTAPDVHASMMKLGRALGRVAVSVRGHVMSRLLAAYYREAFFLLEEGASQGEVDLALTEFGFRVGPIAALADPALAALLGGQTPRPGSVRRRITADEIRERCIYAVINEAARVLEEKAAARPLDIDMIWVQGLGFPLYRGGPLFYADQLGLAHVHERILKFQEQLGEEYWTPAPLIERKAREGGGFYAKG